MKNCPAVFCQRKRILGLISGILVLCILFACAHAEGGRTIKYGVKGDDVIVAQQRLIELGYYTGDADGRFDSKTRTAVKDYQQANGMEQTGSLTAQQQMDLLYADVLTRAEYDVFCPLEQGDKGNAVLILQRRLTELGYYNGELDSKYGSGLKNAVKEFQTANSIKSTGKADLSTRHLMNSDQAVTKSQYNAFCALGSGDKGEAVLLLQMRLNELGYYSGELDGKYNSAVKTAVKKFQEINGFKATGTADMETRLKMNHVDAVPASEYDKYCALKYGNNNQAVSVLQVRLGELGFYNANVGTKYDAATRTAVTEFQTANGLKATGAADFETRRVMNGKDAVPSEEFYMVITLKYGASSAAVRILQRQLQSLGYYEGEITNSYDSETRSAVKLFQKANSIKESGNADDATRIALMSPEAVSLSDYDQIRPLEHGNSGDAVYLVQNQLARLGYYEGTPTGKFDKATKEAVKTFQQANNLTVNSRADTVTRKLLNGGKAVTCAEYDTFRPLASGDSGNAVELMQRRLGQLGFYWAEDITGKYDSDTKSAVKAFQTANGIKANGTASTATRNAMNAGTAVTRAAYDANRTIAKGEKTTTVRLIKLRLDALGYYTGEINVTYDNALVNSVKLFQKAHSLGVTGKADVETRRVMFSGEATTYAIYQTYCPFSYGEKGEMVRKVQQQLLNLGYYNGLLDGVYGSGMRTAVRQFEKANNLTLSDHVTMEMRKLLNSGNALSLSGYYAICDLKNGSEGEPVRVLQRRLVELGFYTGEVDGKYGSGVEKAVAVFQKANALSETGTADRATRILMNSASAKSMKQYQKELEEMIAVTRAEKIEKLIAVAESKLGCKYVLNSSGPDTFDCSNYTKYCFAQVDIRISGRVLQQGYMTNYSKILNIKELQRGDLLIFDTVKTDDDLSDHAGIYLGNNQFIHCSSVRGEVVVSKLSSYGDFSWAFRLI